MPHSKLIDALYESAGVNPHSLRGDAGIARIEVHHNRVLGLHLLPGLEVDATEDAEGISAEIRVTEETVIDKPIQVCFGMMPETGVQRINLDIQIERGARAGIIAHCIFPNARKIRHLMDASLTIGPGAEYAYFERHVHGAEGGVVVVPKSKVYVCEDARYQTDFELIRGRVGRIEIDLEVTVEARAVADVTARISGRGDDEILIDERAHLVGEYARGVLKSHIALRDTACADIRNTLIATAAFARGHVDCKEIVQGDAVARATPVVEVRHPQAHVTHEAAIGSVDSKQLETLMSRGINEEEAVDLIIQGLLGRSGGPGA